MKSMAVSDCDDDESLMKAIKMGNHQAFSLLVKRHTDRFFKTAYRLCGNAPEAEDLVQDAFLKIWHKPDRWKEGKGAKFTTWFYRILVNQRIDSIRQSQKTAPTKGDFFDGYADDRKNPEAQLLMEQEHILIERAISSLPERQKMAITMCFYEGLSNSDAAYAMDVNIKGLESLLMRAKSGIRDFLKTTKGEFEDKEVKYAIR